MMVVLKRILWPSQRDLMTLMTLSTSRLSHVGPLPKLRDAEDLEEKNEIKPSATKCPSIHPYSSYLLVYSFPLKSFMYFYCVFYLCLCISSWFFIRLHSTQQLDNLTHLTPLATSAWSQGLVQNIRWELQLQGRTRRANLVEAFEHLRKVCAYLIWSIGLNQVGHRYLISKMMQLSLMCLNKIQEIHRCSALWRHNSSRSPHWMLQFAASFWSSLFPVHTREEQELRVRKEKEELD